MSPGAVVGMARYRFFGLVQAWRTDGVSVRPASGEDLTRASTRGRWQVYKVFSCFLLVWIGCLT